MTQRFFPVLALSVATAVSAQTPRPAVPDGTRLATGEYCYTMSATKDGVTTPVGVTFQSVSRVRVRGVDALAIVVHQHMANGHFDMRDSLLVHRDTLLPIELNTVRNGQPHAHLDYTAHRIEGWKVEHGAKQPISMDLPGPVWDGNLWGETFAALPLSEGASLSLPTFQYDSGLGQFLVDVVGKQPEALPSGTVDAWRIRAGLHRDEQVGYVVSTQPGLEISYSAGPSTQHLGGDCAGVR